MLGRYIFTGTVVGSEGSYKNSVFEVLIRDSTSMRLVHVSTGDVVVYNELTESFEQVVIGITNPNTVEQVNEAAGLNFAFVGPLNIPLSGFTKESIVGRIDPL